MLYEKITDKDLQGKGVVGLPDTPQLTAQDMQEKFEETARSVIVPKFNSLIDCLTAHGQPVQSENVMLVRIGENGDLQMSQDGENWRNAAENALRDKADGDSVYTKEQTEEAINKKVVEIGTGDMAKAVYDADNDDVVDNAKNAQLLDGHSSEYFATAERAKTAMPKSGGEFTGAVKAIEAPMSGGYLRNISIRGSEGDEYVATYGLEMYRK